MMYRKIILSAILCFAAFAEAGEKTWSHSADGAVFEFQSEDRPRVLILTDMTNEPDDTQTAVRLLMYANELDIEGLIAVNGFWLQDRVAPETLHDLIDNGYALVEDHLSQHASGWPSAESLKTKVAGGQTGYGMEGVGDGLETDGSNLIIQALLKDDPRPIYIGINAGANTLAQALRDISASYPKAEADALMAKIRVLDDTGQDNAGAWITHTYPDEVFYIRSIYQIFAFMGHTIGIGSNYQGPKVWADNPLAANSWTDDQHYAAVDGWCDDNIRTGHGPLGAKYPHRPPWTMEGGGTTSWIGHVNKGLYDGAHRTWGGWSGRFNQEKTLNAISAMSYDAGFREGQAMWHDFYMYTEARDTWTEGDTEWGLPAEQWENSDDAPVWRFREAHFNEFKARADWSVAEYADANHNPKAVLFGDTTRTIVTARARPGAAVTLDASASFDPDGDNLTFKWWVYPEAGTYSGDVSITAAAASSAVLQVPADGDGKQIHVVLEVEDDSPIARLTAYRRIVVDITSDISPVEGKNITFSPYRISSRGDAWIFQGGPGETARIFDTGGREMLQVPLDAYGKVEVAKSSLPRGIYILKSPGRTGAAVLSNL